MDKPTQEGAERPRRRPPWIKVRAASSEAYHELRRLMRDQSLHTVCEEARCPNIGECWKHRTATFLILGDTCTRNCRFCNVKTGRPGPLDPGEPERVAQAVQAMELKHAVIMLSIVSERIPGRSKYMVLKYLRMGVIDIDDITDDDMRAIAKWYTRVRRLGAQIEELRRARRWRRW